MDFEKYHIYAVEGDAALAKVDECVRLGNEGHERRVAWAKAQGGTMAVLNGNNVVGILAEDGAKLVDGWKIGKGRCARGDGKSDPYYVPDQRKKAGKAIAEQMRSMRRTGVEDVANALGAKGFVIGPAVGRPFGGILYHPFAFKQGDQWILAVPIDGDKPAPEFDGCRPLKLSEFYALKEAAEAETAGAA